MSKSEKKVTVIKPINRIDGTPIVEHKITRVAAYARVSTDKSDQLNSLETQKQYFYDNVKLHQGWELVEVYADEGLSGLNTKKRVNFNRMIEDARNGKIDLILSKSISRFARNVLDTISFTRELKNLGIPVYFGKENINTFDPNGEFLLNFMASFAEEGSKSISKNVKWALTQKYASGCVSLPYKNFLGYKRGEEKFQMVIDPKQAKIVRLIYKLYLNGQGLKTIVEILNKQEIPSPMKKKWSSGVIKSILTNEKYIGDALLQKTYTSDIFTKKHKKNDGIVTSYYVENDHPAIIGKDTFKETQEQLVKRRNVDSYKFFFSKRLYCTKCGDTYSRNYYYNDAYSEAVMRWICCNKHKKEIRCDNIILYEDELNYALSKVLIQIIKHYVIGSELNEAIHKVIKDESRLKKIDEIISKKCLTANAEMIDIFNRIVIERISVFPERILKFFIIDGSVITYKMPKWSITYSVPYNDVRITKVNKEKRLPGR